MIDWVLRRHWPQPHTMSTRETQEERIRSAHADGAVGIDYGWKTKLGKLMKSTPLSPSLVEAVKSLRNLLCDDDFEVLEAVIQVCAC